MRGSVDVIESGGIATAVVIAGESAFARLGTRREGDTWQVAVTIAGGGLPPRIDL